MSKIYLIGDTHIGLGYPNNVDKWYKVHKEYFDKFLIPLLKKEIRPGDIIVHLGDLFDKLLETALSKYPKLNEITVNNTIDNNVKLSSYITGKLEEISDFRKELTESDFQNQFDTIVEEFRHLAYLLTLK